MKFFSAFIMVPLCEELSSIRFDISRNGSHRRGILCKDNIPFYANCNKDDQFESKMYLYSLFVEKELLLVKKFFLSRFGLEVIAEETPIPRPRRSQYPAHWEAQSHGLYCGEMEINSRLNVFVSEHYKRERYVCGPDYYDPDWVIEEDYIYDDYDVYYDI